MKFKLWMVEPAFSFPNMASNEKLDVELKYYRHCIGQNGMVCTLRMTFSLSQVLDTNFLANILRVLGGLGKILMPPLSFANKSWLLRDCLMMCSCSTCSCVFGWFS